MTRGFEHFKATLLALSRRHNAHHDPPRSTIHRIEYDAARPAEQE